LYPPRAGPFLDRADVEAGQRTRLDPPFEDRRTVMRSRETWLGRAPALRYVTYEFSRSCRALADGRVESEVDARSERTAGYRPEEAVSGIAESGIA
jgi:hypothetical protein